VSTTVDADLLDGARRARSGATDAALIDEALAALLARDRAAELLKLWRHSTTPAAA
jgi:hypothetical protein